MPVVATDDLSRRVRNIYLGPRGWRLPDARFEAWGLFIACTILFAVLAVIFAPTFRLDVFGVVVSPLPALLVTRRVMRKVEYDTPLRHWREVLANELATPRPPAGTVERSIAPSNVFLRVKGARR